MLECCLCFMPYPARSCSHFFFFFSSSSSPAGYQTFTLYLYSPPIINQSRGSLLSSDPLSYRLSSSFPHASQFSTVFHLRLSRRWHEKEKHTYVRTCVPYCGARGTQSTKKVRRGESPGIANCVHPTASIDWSASHTALIKGRLFPLPRHVGTCTLR